MASALLLLVWLSAVTLAQPQPPGYFQQIPLPLIHFKLGKDRNIVSSTKHNTWNQLFTTTDSAAEPATSDIPVYSVNGTSLPSYDTVFTFDQLMDHNNTKLGTFKQRYYFTYEFFEPGGPIFFSVPSESSLENYDGSVTNSTLNGYLAQQNRGAAIVLEHRFFGQSNPYPDLSEESLALLTVEQAIADVVYFAQNVKLNIPGVSKTSPDKLPWVLVGGSYPGALVAWTMTTHPNMFAAGWASSAVVQSQNFFWSYFDVVNQFMPSNCSADIRAVVNYLDQTFTTGSPIDQAKAKAQFALSNVQYADDVVAAIRAPLFSWQDLQPYYQDTNAGFYAFCNYLEYDRNKKQYETTGSGVGLQTALSAYGNWTQYEIRAAGCIGHEESCYGTHSVNSSATWSNTTVDNNHRSWAWLYCNEFGFFFSGAPNPWPSLVSRLTTPDSEARVCSMYFPKTFPMGITANEAHNESAFNAKYGGWDISTTNVFFANGKKDAWRGVTLSSDLYNHVSTTQQPIAVADGGFHCSDLVIQAGLSEPSVQAVQNLGAAYVYKWLSQWYTTHNITRPSNVTAQPDPTALPTPTFSPESIPTTVLNSSWLAIGSLAPVAALPSTGTASDLPPSISPPTGTRNYDNAPTTKTKSSNAASFRARARRKVVGAGVLVALWVLS